MIKACRIQTGSHFEFGHVFGSRIWCLVIIFWNNRVVEKIEQQLKTGKFEEAKDSWIYLEELISASSNGVVIIFINSPIL